MESEHPSEITLQGYTFERATIMAYQIAAQPRPTMRLRLTDGPDVQV